LRCKEEVALLELVDAANELANKAMRLAVANARLGNGTVSERFRRDYLSARFDCLQIQSSEAPYLNQRTSRQPLISYTLWRAATFVSERAAQLRGTTLSLPSVRTG